MTAKTKGKTRWRQVLLSCNRRDGQDDYCSYYLETLKVGQRGPRRMGRILGEGWAVCGGRDGWDSAAPVGVILDWLEEHPYLVEGLKTEDVLSAVAAVRSRGFWFCTPEKLP